MLCIRSEQMATFFEYARRQFEDRMVAHLLRCFPDPVAALGEQETRKAVQHGMERAETYGITAERDVCRYIDVMFAFGRDFDTDKELSWAAGILQDEQITDPPVKAERLFDQAQLHSEQAGGIVPAEPEETA